MNRGTTRILLIEDNILIAMDMEEMISEQGLTPVGPISTLADGIEAVRLALPDGALLDVNLGEDRVWPLAELLDDHRVPFIIATGYSTDEVPDRFKDRHILHKPLRSETLVAALTDLNLL